MSRNSRRITNRSKYKYINKLVWRKQRKFLIFYLRRREIFLLILLIIWYSWGKKRLIKIEYIMQINTKFYLKQEYLNARKVIKLRLHLFYIRSIGIWKHRLRILT
jgi:hypothetical protein